MVRVEDYSEPPQHEQDPNSVVNGQPVPPLDGDQVRTDTSSYT